MNERIVDRALPIREPWALREVQPVSIAAILTLCASAVVFLTLRPTHGIDDADITMVYARHIAEGHGYVYMQGGERVEGSTSLAWTLLCALVFATGTRSMIPLFAMTILLAFATTLAALELARRAAGTRAAVIPTALLMALSPSFFAWSTATLMDVALWSASIAVALLQAISITSRAWSWRLSVAIVALLLARPEGVVIAGVMVLVAFVACASSGMGMRASLRAVLPALVVTAGGFSALVAFRIHYFGYPMPNTYYAKVGGDFVFTAGRGAVYLCKFLVRNPINIPAAIAAIHVLASDGREIWARLKGSGKIMDQPRIARLALSIVLLCGLSLPFVEGADHFVGSRLMQPFVPLACGLLGSFAVGWLASAKKRQLSIGLAASFATALVVWVDFVVTTAPGLNREARIASSGRLMGKWLAAQLEQASPMPTVGVSAAGGIALAYPGRVMDLLGLNWVAMAHGSRDRRGRPGHAAFSSAVFWSDPATLVLPQLLQARPTNACDLSSPWLEEVFHGLLSSDRFRNEYTGVAIATEDGNLGTFVRRDFFAAHSLSQAQALDWPAGSKPCASVRLPRWDD